MNTELIEPEDIQELINYTYRAHQENSTKKDFRQDGKVPFFTHPVWCAITLLMDQRVPWTDRSFGYQALMLHDVIEDTSLGLPTGVTRDVADLVIAMTHETWEEEIDIAQKPPIVRLLKLIDKVSSMYDETVRKEPERRKQWKQLVDRLVQSVERDYPDARILALARTLLQDESWETI
jgi:(p)ppGpp synthase/HD superfamily hydrolase